MRPQREAINKFQQVKVNEGMNDWPQRVSAPSEPTQAARIFHHHQSIIIAIRRSPIYQTLSPSCRNTISSNNHSSSSRDTPPTQSNKSVVIGLALNSKL